MAIQFHSHVRKADRAMGRSQRVGGTWPQRSSHIGKDWMDPNEESQQSAVGYEEDSLQMHQERMRDEDNV